MDLLPAFVGGFEKRLLQQSGVVGDNLFTNEAVPSLVALQADERWNVKNQQTVMIVMTLGQFKQPEPRLLFERGAIGNGEVTVKHAFVDNIMEQVKAIAVDLLIVLII